MAETQRRKAGVRRWEEDQNLLFYRLVYALVRLVMQYWVRGFRTVGVRNVPVEGGGFLIANHASGLDPLLLGVAVPHRVMTGPGKAELFANPLFALMLRALGIFPLRVGVADAGAVRTMVSRYRKGDIVIVYPEGGRSTTEEMEPFNPDFARLVIKLRAPVIPAGIAGARDVLPIGSWIPRHGVAVGVAIGCPFDLSDFYGKPLTEGMVAQATARLEFEVRRCLNEAECARGKLRQGGS